MKELSVVKIGGNVVDNPEALSGFLADFAQLPSPKILVHGGGKIATTISKALGIETQMINGRRVTDEKTLDVVTQVYSGLINKKIVSKLQANGVNSFGLCGADGAFIVSKKRCANPIDFGFVGDPIISQVKVEMASTLLESGLSLVVAPITISEENQLLNTNADTVAQTVAVAMAKNYKVKLIYCFEKRGVLKDVDDDGSLIESITPALFEELKSQGVVADGMLPKLENAFKAIESGVNSVVIRSSKALHIPDGTTLSL